MTKEEILQVVCATFRLNKSAIVDKSRKINLVIARSIYTKLCQESGIEIAKAMHLIHRDRCTYYSLLNFYETIKNKYAAQIQTCKQALNLELFISEIPIKTTPPTIYHAPITPIEEDYDMITSIEASLRKPTSYAPICKFAKREIESMIDACVEAMAWATKN